MQQYVSWANSTGGVVQQFYTDTSIQVSLYLVYTTRDLGKLVNKLHLPVPPAQDFMCDQSCLLALLAL